MHAGEDVSVGLDGGEGPPRAAGLAREDAGLRVREPLAERAQRLVGLAGELPCEVAVDLLASGPERGERGAVIPPVDQHVREEAHQRARREERLEPGDLAVVAAQEVRLHQDGEALVVEQLDGPDRAVEGARPADQSVVDGGVRGVQGDLDGEHPQRAQPAGDLGGHRAAVGEQGDREVPGPGLGDQLERVLAQERLAAGEGQFERAQRLELVEEPDQLGEGEVLARVLGLEAVRAGELAAVGQGEEHRGGDQPAAGAGERVLHGRTSGKARVRSESPSESA